MLVRPHGAFHPDRTPGQQACWYNGLELNKSDYPSWNRRTPDPEFCRLAAEVADQCAEMGGWFEAGMGMADREALRKKIEARLTAIRSGDKAALGKLKEEMGS